VGKPEGNRPFGKLRHSWEKDIKMDIEEWDVGLLSGFTWLRLGIGGGHS
jgi:hypothetical protein